MRVREGMKNIGGWHWIDANWFFQVIQFSGILRSGKSVCKYGCVWHVRCVSDPLDIRKWWNRLVENNWLALPFLQHTNNLFLSLHLSPSFPYFFLKPQFSQTAVLTNILHRPLSLFFLLWLICNSTHCLQNMNTLLAIWQLQLHIEKLWSPGSSSLDHCVLCTYLLPFKWLSFSKLHNLLFKGITPPPSYHL